MPRRPDLSGSDYAAVALSVSRTIGQRIADARAEAGMSQVEAGAAMGRTGQWVAEVETGRIIPRADLLAALAAALGTTVGALLDEHTSDAAGLERALPGWSALNAAARGTIQAFVAGLTGAPASERRAAEEGADYAVDVDLADLSEEEREVVLGVSRASQPIVANAFRALRARQHEGEVGAGRPPREQLTPRPSRPRSA